MALKVLLLRSRLAPLQTELQTLENTRDGFAAREAELEHDIAEAQTDEERSVVEAAVNAFEQERSANGADIRKGAAAHGRDERGRDHRRNQGIRGYGGILRTVRAVRGRG